MCEHMASDRCHVIRNVHTNESSTFCTIELTEDIAPSNVSRRGKYADGEFCGINDAPNDSPIANRLADSFKKLNGIEFVYIYGTKIRVQSSGFRSLDALLAEMHMHIHENLE